MHLFYLCFFLISGYFSYGMAQPDWHANKRTRCWKLSQFWIIEMQIGTDNHAYEKCNIIYPLYIKPFLWTCDGHIYSETSELGTPKGLSNTVLNSEVVLFLRPISMQWIGLGTEVAVLNSQVVPISQAVLKTGFTVLCPSVRATRLELATHTSEAEHLLPIDQRSNRDNVDDVDINATRSM